MIGQWQGDIDNVNIENTVSMLGNAVRLWELAKPIVPLQEPPR